MNNDNTLRQEKERGIWDKQAASYDRQTLKIYRDAYERSIQKVKSVLKPGDRVLEIGCGTGIIALGIADVAGHVSATDIAPNMIAVAQEKADQQGVQNVEFRVSDGYSLPYPSESFDVVLLFNVLHVVKEPGTLLQESYRLLKSGGYMLSATDCYAEKVPLKTQFLLTAQKLLKWLGILAYMRAYKKVELETLIEQQAYSIERTENLHDAPVNYYVLARKVIREIK